MMRERILVGRVLGRFQGRVLGRRFWGRRVLVGVRRYMILPHTLFYVLSFLVFFSLLLLF